MEKKLLCYSNNYLEELRRRKISCEERLKALKGYEGVNLKRRASSSGNWHYCATSDKKVRSKYLGSSDSEEVIRVKEYRFLKKTLSVIENNMALIDKLSKGLKSTDYESIMSQLPKTYRDVKLGSNGENNAKATAWKERAEAFKNRHSIYKPEELNKVTNDGSKLRSKSEVLIYNYLLSMGVTFVYELPLRLSTGTIYPDFTLLSEIDYQTEIFIEHQGMMGNDFYRDRFAEKVYKYLRDGYVPGETVFFTFDRLDGGFDKTPIEDLIRLRVIPHTNQK